MNNHNNIYNGGCNYRNNLCNMSQLLRSPRSFDPQDALSSLCIIKNSYLAIKAGVFNYLYECSDIYDKINQNSFVKDIELRHIGDVYKSLVNDLLSCFQTATTSKLTDCSDVCAFDCIFVADTEEMDSSGNVAYDTTNKAKTNFNDVSVVQYKNFDVVFPKGSMTTFFERPGLQILVDRSNHKVTLRLSMSDQWTPVSRDPYGMTNNKLFSIRNKPTTKTFVMCPSTELKIKGDDTDESVKTSGGIDSSGNPVSGYSAFDSRANLRLFLESVLEPMVSTSSADDWNVNDNDLLDFLGTIDNYIKKSDLAHKTITDKIRINSNLCEYNECSSTNQNPKMAMY